MDFYRARKAGVGEQLWKALYVEDGVCVGASER
jgi:hypothetical protein